MGVKAHMDGDEVIRKASQLASKGDEVQKQITKAMDYFKNLGETKSWTGETYDALVQSMNESLENLNGLVVSVVRDLPYSIASAGQAIVTTGGGTPTVSYADQSFVAIKELSKTNTGTKYDFDEDEISGKLDNMRSQFSQIKENINNCADVAKNLGNDMDSGEGRSRAYDLSATYHRLRDVISDFSNSFEMAIKAQIAAIREQEMAMKARETINEAGKATAEAFNAAAQTFANTRDQAIAELKSLFH